ncbi:nucleolar protein 12-domain-containing protein [Limtongia smithiae]|uniref:nucleolar protein 12-domain-containing protein n=1 Tax=Limtongia smithiae TaxID=1125753 RepID=UPI0034CE6B8A
MASTSRPKRQPIHGGTYADRPGANGRNSRRPQEVVFDREAREQYLTGFHKRNVERKEKAQERAKAFERQNRLDERRAMRDQKKAELQEKMELARQLYAQPDDAISDEEDEDEDEAWSEEDEWTGIITDTVSVPSADMSAPTPSSGILIQPGTKLVTTYNTTSDADASGRQEDTTTTVTIEAYVDDPTTNTLLQHTPQHHEDHHHHHPSRHISADDTSDKVLHDSLVRAAFYADRVNKINHGRPVAPKKKQKAFRYLTPKERKANKLKERRGRAPPKNKK